MAAEAQLVEVTSPDGTVLGVEVLGGGPPLVVVHGGTADRTRWGPVAPALAERFTVHLVDRRGRGASTRETEGPYELEREAEDLLAVAQAAGDDVRLLAHSYGGLVAMEALPHGGPITRALLYEPAFDTPGNHIVPPEALDVITRHIDAGDSEAALTAFFELVIGIDPTPIKTLPMWQARVAAAPTMKREGMIGLQYVPDGEKLGRIAIPVRVLAGTESPPAFGAAARVAVDAIPGAELVWLEGQGHIAMDADPQGFVAQVVDFLA